MAAPAAIAVAPAEAGVIAEGAAPNGVGVGVGNETLRASGVAGVNEGSAATTCRRACRTGRGP